MKITGAEILVQSLKSEKVEYIFGYPGGAVLEIYDALFKLNSIRHILVRHEQAAVHAADAYARTSGEVGVALVTSGPGATNAITGIGTAYTDSIPIIVISGQVPTSLVGTDAFQEIDMVGITRPCVKHNFLVTNINDLISIIKKAFYIAKTGRPGPVVIDIPKDITQKLHNFCYPQEDPFIRSYKPVTKGHIGQIKKALKALSLSKRPLIYFGGGVILSNASEQLTNFVKLTNLPCVSTLMGLGGYNGLDKQFIGMLGMHGLYEANLAMQEADVILAIGARFDDRVIAVPEKFLDSTKTIIHIDIDPSSISKRVTANIPIVGDVKNVLIDMLQMWKEKKMSINATSLEKWWEKIEKWRSKNCLWFDNQDEEILKPQYIIQALAKITNNEAILTSDVGQHQMFAAQYYAFKKPRQWINSGGLGTMGVGLPYAMGAKLACPEKDVFCITGDGSIQMNIQELSTCYQYRIPLKIINLNNGYLGMVRQWQEFYYDNRYSESYFNSLPDFVKLAESYGHVGMRIEKKSDVYLALKEAQALTNKLVFIDFIIDPTENVFPMVGNDKALHEMVLPYHMLNTKKQHSIASYSRNNFDTNLLNVKEIK